MASSNNAPSIDDVSDMSEEDLRRLFAIIRQSNPDVINAALSDLVASYPNDNVFEGNRSSKGRNNTEETEDSESSRAGEVTEADLDWANPAKQKHSEKDSSGDGQYAYTEVGCYMLYDADSCKLILKYSRTAVPNALGFWAPGPGQSIQDFKFRQNFGRADLIGSCAGGVAGRKNYYSGWCQFFRAARSMNGSVKIIPRALHEQGPEADLYVYYKFAKDAQNTYKVPENVMFNVSDPPIDAVACLPKYTDFYEGVSKIDLTRWMTDASTAGAASTFEGPPGGSIPGGSPSRRSLKTEPPSTVKPPEVPSLSLVTSASSSLEPSNVDSDVGCYLVYDADACKLMLNYSKTAVSNALGFWAPGHGHKIQGFKFRQNFGRAELIGNCASGVAGRKNYYSGWCQFVRLAKALNGSMRVIPRNQNEQGLDVDMYVYYKFASNGQQTVKIKEDTIFRPDDPPIDAIACLPKHTDFYEGVSKIDLARWMTDASTIGFASRFE